MKKRRKRIVGQTKPQPLLTESLRLTYKIGYITQYSETCILPTLRTKFTVYYVKTLLYTLNIMLCGSFEVSTVFNYHCSGLILMNSSYPENFQHTLKILRNLIRHGP